VRKSAFAIITAASLWYWNDVTLLSIEHQTAIAKAIGKEAPNRNQVQQIQGWQNNLRSNNTVMSNTMNGMQGNKKLCGHEGARTAIGKKDGKAHLAEFDDAVDKNIRGEEVIILGPVLAAVRYAENGGDDPHLEYGVRHPGANTYRDQAGWSAATIQKGVDRWRAGSDDPSYPNWEPYKSNPTPPHPGGMENPDDVEGFLEWFGNIYAPLDADNDPDGLNKNWAGNVHYLFEKFYYCEPPV